MYIDPTLITGNIIEAYDTFASLGFEKTIIIEDYDLDTGDKTDYTTVALQLNKDTVKVGKDYQFLTEAHPSVYLKETNLPRPNMSAPPNETDNRLMYPDHSQRLYKTEDTGRQQSVYSINRIFNLVVIRLKP